MKTLKRSDLQLIIITSSETSKISKMQLNLCQQIKLALNMFSLFQMQLILLIIRYSYVMHSGINELIQYVCIKLN